MTDADAETVLGLRLHGISVRAIAKQLRCSVDEVNATLDQLSEQVTTAYKVRAIFLDLERLDALQRTFYQKAVLGDVNAGTLCIKISERRAQLIGLDSPTRVDVIQLRAAAQPALSSTDKIMAALTRLSTTNGSGERATPEDMTQ